MDKDLEFVKTKIFKQLLPVQKIKWFFEEYLSKPKGKVFGKLFVSKLLGVKEDRLKEFSRFWPEKVWLIKNNIVLYGNEKDLNKLKKMIVL